MTKNTKNTDKKISSTSASSAWAGCSTYPSEKRVEDKSEDTPKTNEEFYKKTMELLKKLYQDFIEAVPEEYWDDMDDDDDDDEFVEEDDADDSDADEEEELLDLDSVSDGATYEFSSLPVDSKVHTALEKQNEEITHKIEALEDRVSKLEQGLSKLLRVSSEKNVPSTTTTLILTDDNTEDAVEAIKAFFGLDN